MVQKFKEAKQDAINSLSEEEKGGANKRTKYLIGFLGNFSKLGYNLLFDWVKRDDRVTGYSFRPEFSGKHFREYDRIFCTYEFYRSHQSRILRLLGKKQLMIIADSKDQLQYTQLIMRPNIECGFLYEYPDQLPSKEKIGCIIRASEIDAIENPKKILKKKILKKKIRRKKKNKLR